MAPSSTRPYAIEDTNEHRGRGVRGEKRIETPWVHLHILGGRRDCEVGAVRAELRRAACGHAVGEGEWGRDGDARLRIGWSVGSNNLEWAMQPGEGERGRDGEARLRVEWSVGNNKSGVGDAACGHAAGEGER